MMGGREVDWSGSAETSSELFCTR